MTAIAETARKFWSAANFYRRAPDRDRTVAIEIIRQIAETTSGPLQERAASLLREIDNGTDTDTPGAI